MKKLFTVQLSNGEGGWTNIWSGVAKDERDAKRIASKELQRMMLAKEDN